MPIVQCPVKGFEQVSINVPEHWLVRHNESFWRAYRAAGDEVSYNTALLHGSIAAVNGIKGIPQDTAVEDWPLELFLWIIQTVYRDGLEKALNPPKN